MTKLLVALDMPPRDGANLASQLVGIPCGFKVGLTTLLHNDGPFLVKTLVRDNRVVLLDLKLYDTRDTVKQVMRQVDALGVHMVTVHVDVVSHAVNLNSAAKIIAVGKLTDGGDPFVSAKLLNATSICDGAICLPDTGAYMKRVFPDKIIICPGVRPEGASPDNHKWPLTPAEVARGGVKYIVVGRPIYQAPDPVAAARRIVEEIAAA